MKTFLSVGAGPGMGYETAARFGHNGFRVVLAARNGGRVDDLAKRLANEGITAVGMTVDASDPQSVEKLIANVSSDFGSIDVLHYNAASMRKETLTNQPSETFNTDLAINIGGAMAAAKAASTKMITRGEGTILLTGGGFGLQPSPDYLSLSIGKAGIRALALGLFEDFKAKGVHVATVTVATFIDPGSEEAKAVAEHFWQLYSQSKEVWTPEIQYAP